MSLLSGYAWCTGRTGKVRSTWPRAESLERAWITKSESQIFSQARTLDLGWNSAWTLLVQYLPKEPILTRDTFRKKSKGRVPNLSWSPKAPGLIYSLNDACAITKWGISPPLRMSEAGLLNTHTAKCAPCHSSPSLCHAPLDIGSRGDLCAPEKTERTIEHTYQTQTVTFLSTMTII